MSQLMPRMPRSSGARRSAGAADKSAPGKTRQIWLLKDGVAEPLQVSVGISDGRMTEVTSDALQEGMQVTTDQRSAAAAP